jgi:hypothetical protein
MYASSSIFIKSKKKGEERMKRMKGKTGMMRQEMMYMPSTPENHQKRCMQGEDARARRIFGAIWRPAGTAEHSSFTTRVPQARVREAAAPRQYEEVYLD